MYVVSTTDLQIYLFIASWDLSIYIIKIFFYLFFFLCFIFCILFENTSEQFLLCLGHMLYYYMYRNCTCVYHNQKFNLCGPIQCVGGGPCHTLVWHVFFSLAQNSWGNLLTLILPTPKEVSLCHQYSARPACTSMHSDQALYCWLTNFKFSSWYP